MNKVKIFSILLFFFIAYLFISFPFYSGDVKNHLVWAKSILAEGTLGFYERQFHDFAFPNYPPLSMFLFAISLKLYEITTNIIWFLNTKLPIFPSGLVPFFAWENVQISFLKLPAILSNIGIALALFLLYRRFLLSLIFLINPAAIYLSIVWGQIDLLPIMFLMFALYFFKKEKIFWTFVFAASALLSKQTVIIFWLILTLLVLKNFGIKKLIQGALVTILIFYISYLPFHSLSLTWPVELYKYNFSLVAFSTSVNTINFWGFIDNFKGMDDTQKFFLTLNNWSYLLFSLVFTPLLVFFLKQKITIHKVMIFFFITTLLYFFFLTRMHERYLVPVTIFASAIVFIDKRFWASLIFFSFLHFLNLYRGLLQPDIGLFNNLSSSLIFLKALVSVYLILLIYNIYLFLKFDEKRNEGL